MIQILTGDFRELSRDLADDSVDLVLTDPVYDRIDDYRYLAETAARVLKPGGSVIAQTGHYYFLDAANAMAEHLSYVWVQAEVYNYCTARHWQRRIMVGWKPWLWFSKGDRCGGWLFDRYNGGGRDKSLHEWGDSLAFSLNCIEKLTQPGDLVLDPFLGGGTTVVACLQTNRRFIGYEIDPDTADVARRRVERERLFVAEPEPVQLSIDAIGQPRCKFCGAVLDNNGGPGRKKEYCDDTCRLRAFRFRQRELKRNVA